jgi:hypothetical protein
MKPYTRILFMVLGALLVFAGLVLGVTSLTLCFGNCGMQLALRGGVIASVLLVGGILLFSEAYSL